MKNCELVVSVGGTSCFEAGFFGKHAIMFADLGYSAIPSVKKLNSYDELHDTINQCIMSTVELNFVKKYVEMLDKHSFDFDFLDMLNKMYDWFYFNGRLVDVVIDEKHMKLFLTNNKKEFEKLSLEFVKKINDYESVTVK